MRDRILAGVVTSALLVTIALIASHGTALPEEQGNVTMNLEADEITTTWNLTFLFPDGETAALELQRLKNASQKINSTYREQFDNLTGKTLRDHTEDNKNFTKSLDVLYTYAYTENSLNVNDAFFEALFSDAQNLSTEHNKAVSFAEVKLKSLSRDEWERLFRDEPELEKYRQFFENSYIRYADHRPRNESHAAYLADLGNELLKLETDGTKRITNNVTKAGNVTLIDGSEFAINSQTYSELMSTDPERENRRRCYDKRFYHTINESEEMAKIYIKKSELDDLYARELNFTDAYNAKMFNYYLREEQIEEMNSVLRERKGVFDGYYEFRKKRMGLDPLRPYDLSLQLTSDPGKKYNYTDSLREIYSSYAKMDPAFREIFLKTVTGNYIDVYPNPEGGKQPGGYCASLWPLMRPSLIFLNYQGLLEDKTTITHELGHATNDYLMSSNVDYLYCGETMYEAEIPSTFNEELFIDYALKNYDNDTAIAFLAEQISNYENLFVLQAMITEFERQAHLLCQERDNVSASDLNALWTRLLNEYRTDKVEWYGKDEASWTRINHIFRIDNYYTFNYALSGAITLSLFKKYQEDPEKFNKNYVAYLSAGTAMTPPEKLQKYFGIEINRDLFEDAMDMVEMRVKQLEELEKGNADQRSPDLLS
jgi:oligoendopeptidase F